MSGERWWWFIAGPNGAGKSTRAREYFAGFGEIVNPDEIARALSPENPEQNLGAAGRAAIERRRELLEAGESLSIETTLSGRTLLQFARTAQQAGWKIGLVYVGLCSPDQAIERVKQRVALGGHDVPLEDIRRRYARSLASLPAFLAMVDRAIVFDNSSEKGPLKLLESEDRKVTFVHRRPPSGCARALALWLESNHNRENHGDSYGLQNDHL
jgi:predicted ABC-type ATPase